MKKYLTYIIVSAFAAAMLSAGVYAADETTAAETTTAGETTTAAATTTAAVTTTPDVTVDDDADLTEDEDNKDEAPTNPGTGVGLMTLGFLAAGTAGAAAAFRKRK